MASMLDVMGVFVFVVWCVWLSVYDVRERRLPNWLTVPGAALVLVAAAAVGQFSVALMGGMVLFVPYLLVHLITPRALGGGDVKLAFGLGAATALAGASAWVLAALLAPVLTALVGLVALAMRRSSVVAHGPGMCAASVLAVVGAGW